jgi:hypothetical protein
MVAGHSWGAWELGFLRLLHRENFGSGLGAQSLSDLFRLVVLARSEKV